MKKILVISPYFPPANAADMHRIRTSLPYFSQFGLQAEVVAVELTYTDIIRDELLLQSIPSGIKVHHVKAFSKKWTSWIGLGSIALRSLWFYKNKVDQLLKTGCFDLIYFSTTQFPVCILGPYWKKKFHVPYVIDMQDPWHSDYYRDKPKEQQPAKYWFSYRLNKYLEPIAMKQAGGLVSVSKDYLLQLMSRYGHLKIIPAATITFGTFEPDLKIAADQQHLFIPVLQPGFKNLVYVGRGGADMHQAIKPVFEVLKNEPELCSQIRCYFIGTSYAPAGQGTPSILPLAREYGVENSVVEITDRISYYHSLVTLLQADALFIPGSDDAQYTASKIYPYLLTRKPLLAILHQESSALAIIREFGVKEAYDFQSVSRLNVSKFLNDLINSDLKDLTLDAVALEKHSSLHKTQMQSILFKQVIGNGEN